MNIVTIDYLYSKLDQFEYEISQIDILLSKIKPWVECAIDEYTKYELVSIINRNDKIKNKLNKYCVNLHNIRNNMDIGVEYDECTFNYEMYNI